MQITIKINKIDLTCVEVVEAIQRSRLAAKDYSPLMPKEKGKLADINGNTIGSWETIED